MDGDGSIVVVSSTAAVGLDPRHGRPRRGQRRGGQPGPGGRRRAGVPRGAGDGLPAGRPAPDLRPGRPLAPASHRTTGPSSGDRGHRPGHPVPGRTRVLVDHRAVAGRGLRGSHRGVPGSGRPPTAEGTERAATAPGNGSAEPVYDGRPGPLAASVAPVGPPGTRPAADPVSGTAARGGPGPASGQSTTALGSHGGDLGCGVPDLGQDLVGVLASSGGGRRIPALGLPAVQTDGHVDQPQLGDEGMAGHRWDQAQHGRLLVGHHVGHRPDPAAGHRPFGQPDLPLGGRGRGQWLGQQGVQLMAVADPVAVGEEAGVLHQRGPVEHVAQGREQPVVGRGHHEHAVARLEGLVGGEEGGGRAGPARVDPRGEQPAHVEP